LPPSKHADLADANLGIDFETSSYADATHRDTVMIEYPYNPPVAPNISIPISATSEHSLSSKTLEGPHMNLATYYSFEPMRFPTNEQSEPIPPQRKNDSQDHIVYSHSYLTAPSSAPLGTGLYFNSNSENSFDLN
jgi:hypothetical protein